MTKKLWNQIRRHHNDPRYYELTLHHCKDCQNPFVSWNGFHISTLDELTLA